MCYSFKTSLTSYILGIASAVFAFITRQVVLGCLIMSYSQMQLSEMMIWHGIDNNDKNWNKTGTTFGKFLLPIHNFAIGLGIILSVIFISKRNLKPTDFIPIVVGTLFYLGIVVFVYLPNKYPDMTFPLSKTCNKCENPNSNVTKKPCNNCQNPENRLIWPYPHMWYGLSFVISLFILFFWIKPENSQKTMLIFFSLSFLMAILIYPRTVGSVWCWSTSFIAPVIVLVNYYLIKDSPNSLLLT
jgi:hypothetical protein